MSQINIVVIGAGVSGLTTALLLAEQVPNCTITVAAKHMPGDLDSVEYASPWAGANFIPAAKKGSEEAKYEIDTFPVLCHLAKNIPEAGIHFQECKISIKKNKQTAASSSDWFSTLTDAIQTWKEIFPDYTQIPKSELVPGIESTSKFTTVVLNAPYYLNYLVSRLLALGVIFKRQTFSHVLDARTAHHSGKPAHMIINCPGISARTMGGVLDKSMVPARAQTVLVRNSAPFQGSVSGLDDADGEVTYLMARPVAGGTVLGGCYQKGNWSGTVDLALADRIMQRAVDFCPELTKDGPLDVISRNVGLRPVRLGGFRVEKEDIRDGRGEVVKVIHNYGHGGSGYQTSYGCAMKVIDLIKADNKELNRNKPKL